MGFRPPGRKRYSFITSSPRTGYSMLCTCTLSMTGDRQERNFRYDLVHRNMSPTGKQAGIGRPMEYLLRGGLGSEAVWSSMTCRIQQRLGTQRVHELFFSAGPGSLMRRVWPRIGPSDAPRLTTAFLASSTMCIAVQEDEIRARRKRFPRPNQTLFTFKSRQCRRSIRHLEWC